MKKVMLLGDSIRQSYQPLVAERLRGEAEVWGPEDNGKFVKYTLWYFQAWLDECGRPDVIHWNNGIWDVYRQNDAIGVFTSLEDYLRDLARTLVEMRRVGATVVWATTTPVDDRFPFVSNERVDAYNAAAARFMAEQGVPLHDLHAVVDRDRAAFLGSDLLHLSEAGRNACADAVAAAVRRYL